MARIVLVHGALGGAWVWEPVVAPLEALGHSVETFDLPGSGDDDTPVEQITLDNYVAKVRSVLESRPDPAVLVGHSMGGVVVTQTASLTPDRVASLVFVCGFMPSNGQSLLDLTKLPEGAGDQIQANIVVEGDPPVATLPADAAVVALHNRLPAGEAAAAAERRGPQAAAPFATPVQVDDSVLASIPRWYVLTTDDQAIPPALQRRMIAEHPCEAVVELEADHMPMLSDPEGTVAALDRFAGGGS